MNPITNLSSWARRMSSITGQFDSSPIDLQVPTRISALGQGLASEPNAIVAPSENAPAMPVTESRREDRSTPREALDGIVCVGQKMADWRNVFVGHAMPVILQAQRQLTHTPMDQAAIRMRLALEVRHFRDRLSACGCAADQLHSASYLLCTYLDEMVSNTARSVSQIAYDGERSLLVEFHDDAWGGERAFVDLVRWMKIVPRPIDLLAFYELILSLGWQGRYQVLERGPVLLQDLRSTLHSLIWQDVPVESLGCGLSAPPARLRRWWSPLRLGLVMLGVVLLAYGGAHIALALQGAPLRDALEAWTPPTRAINLAQTLPPPLPQLLSEGWLTAYKHPQGWLLVFRSDGAFDAGSAQVRSEFRPKIERLAAALAPWPGDLEVIGHTDRMPIASGEYPNNQALSEARARTVAELLRKAALPDAANGPANAVSRTVTYSGQGDTQPIDSGRTVAADVRNRRVDVLWKVATSRQVAPTVAPASHVQATGGVQ